MAFFNPYKLRHSYATALRAQGMDLADVQELMGHKSAKTTQRYAMVAPKKLAAAAKLLHQAWHPERAVVRAGDTLEVLATNTLANQSFIASPIAVDDTLYLRSRTHLFAIGR